MVSATLRPHCTRLRTSDAEEATVRRALDLTRATRRGLLLTACNAALMDVEGVSAAVRAAEQRDNRDLARALDSLRAVAASRKGARMSAFDARTVLAALRVEVKP